MTKSLIALVALMFTPALLAKDCGKKPAIQKNSVIAYFNCKKDDKSCVQLKDMNDEQKKLNDSTKVVIGVKSAAYGTETISIKLTPNGTCWIEKLTSENQGEEMSLVVNDIVIYSPTIVAPIKGSGIEIHASKKEAKDQLSVICKNIDQKCKPMKEQAKKPEVDAFKLPSFNRLEVNEKYGAVMESATWYTEKTSIPVYETSDLKKLKENYIPLIMKSKSGKDQVWFDKQQEFNYTTKSFVFSGGAIKILDLGWIKREDLVPANVLESRLSPESAFVTSFMLEKCSENIGKAMEAAKQSETFKDLLKEHPAIFRSSEIGLCATEGESVCRAKINEIKAQITNTPCDKL